MRKQRKSSKSDVVQHLPQHTVVLLQYIALQNPRGVRQLAYKYGYPAPATGNGMVRFMAHLMTTEGETGLDDIFRVHPDREAIIEVGPAPMQSVSTLPGLSLESLHSNFTGNTSSDLVNGIADFVVRQPAKAVQLLQRHGYQVGVFASQVDIGKRLISALLDGNPVFSQELGLLVTNSPTSNWVTAALGAVGAIGGAFSSVQNRKAVEVQAQSDVTLAILNRQNATMAARMGENQTKSEGKNAALYITSAFGLVVVIGLIMYLLKQNQ